MKCLQCGEEFIPKRKTALFHSDKCRLNYNRGRKVVVPGTNVVLDLDAPLTEEEKNTTVVWSDGKDEIQRFKGESILPVLEKIKKEHCPECKTFDSGIHWCPNKKCGCFETKEEQEADIKKHQAACSHPIAEQLYSRCMHCMAMIPWVPVKRKPMLKESKKK